VTSISEAVVFWEMEPEDQDYFMRLSATTLPLVFALTEIGLASGTLKPENAAALVGAGVLSVLFFSDRHVDQAPDSHVCGTAAPRTVGVPPGPLTTHRQRQLVAATAIETDADPILLISTVLAALSAGGVEVTASTGILTGDEPVFSRRVCRSSSGWPR
jgi:hypothetical protein